MLRATSGCLLGLCLLTFGNADLALERIFLDVYSRNGHCFIATILQLMWFTAVSVAHRKVSDDLGVCGVFSVLFCAQVSFSW